MKWRYDTRPLDEAIFSKRWCNLLRALYGLHPISIISSIVFKEITSCQTHNYLLVSYHAYYLRQNKDNQRFWGTFLYSDVPLYPINYKLFFAQILMHDFLILSIIINNLFKSYKNGGSNIIFLRNYLNFGKCYNTIVHRNARKSQSPIVLGKKEVIYVLKYK